VSGQAGAPAKTLPKGRRWVLPTVIAVVILLVGFVVLFLVPVRSSSKEVQVSPGSYTTTELSIPQAGWVTVHFDRPGGMGMDLGMMYWMDGPGGMMFNHSMMGGTDSYSFWTWGGATYHCGAGDFGGGSGTMTVWVNATWALL